ncbi:MAG TPA: hypothetical protein VHK06_05825 [Candidatus Limnocylindria bacterium]|nr:hypothetical protein [Candidatus Limnocylindria bacterium]
MWGTRGIGVGLLILSACAQPPGSETQRTLPTHSAELPAASTAPGRTPAPTGTTLAASPAATRPASPSPAPRAEFAHGDVIEVTADGLAARAEPSESAPLAAAWENVDDEWRQVEDEVRLGAGHLVTVDLGPIPAQEIVWYRVREKVQPGQNPTRHWDVTGDGPQPSESSAWIAVREGNSTYVRMSEPGGEDPGWMRVVAAGSSDFVSEPFPRHDVLHAEWALSLGTHPAPCDFDVVVEGADTTASEPAVPMISESLSDGFAQGRADADAAALQPIQASAEFRLRIRAGCDWALTLAALPHD